MTPLPRALADRIEALLPQTQCRRCGHDGCRPYAEAIAEGAPLNRCAPGGAAAIAALAAATARETEPLDAAFGVEAPLALARIDESRCIGCTLCIDACPVDAIVGAQKRMHTVIAALCSGCALCVAPCPVDCIDMIGAGRAWSADDAQAAKARHDARNARLAALVRDAAHADVADAERANKAAAVARAVERARARRVAQRGSAP